MAANPNVQADRGRVALQRGPLVYCFEQCDNPDVRVDRIVLAKDPEFKVETRRNFISSDRDNDATKGAASRTVDVVTCKDAYGNTLTAVPYCVWDNRAPGRMCVWVRQAGLDSESEDYAKAENWTDAAGDPILYKPLDASVLTDSVPDRGVEFNASFLTDPLSTLDFENQAETPKNSCDKENPRATWQDRKGTREWFGYSFPEPRKLASATVYWFDDRTAGGGCRVPVSWRVLYRGPGSSEWREVKARGPYTVDRDKDNNVAFEEIEAKEVRIEVQLQDSFSGGILRWVVK